MNILCITGRKAASLDKNYPLQSFPVKYHSGIDVLEVSLTLGLEGHSLAILQNKKEIYL